MKLGSKLYLGFGSVLAILAATCVWMTVSLHHIAENTQEIQDLESMMMSLRERESGYLEWISTLEQGLVDGSTRVVEVETAPKACRFGSWYYGRERAAAESAVPAIREPLDDIEEYHTIIHRSASRIYGALAGDDRLAAVAEFREVTLPASAKMRGLLKSVDRGMYEALLSAQSDAFRDVERFTNVIAVLGLAGIIVGFAMAFLIVSRVMKQMGGDPCEVVKAAHRIADGDLSLEIGYNRKAQSSALACLNKMVQVLHEFISGITSEANSLAGAIDRVFSGSQALSRRSSRRAASMEEASASLEEAFRRMKEHAGNALQAREASAETVKTAEEARLAAADAASAMGEAGDCARKVSVIGAAIGEIAFQTNLLALNAAVESDRALGQGKDFAVVVEEVGNLARRLDEASREIATCTREALETVERAASLSGKVKDAIEETFSRAVDTSGLVADAASMGGGQLPDLEGISASVSEIGSLLKQDASLANETGAAGEEAAAHARSILAQIRRVKTSKG